MDAEKKSFRESGSPAGEPDSTTEDLFRTVTSVSHHTFELISSLGQLVTMEAALALQTIPRLFEVRIAILFFGTLAWLSFCVICSIAVFDLTQWMLAAATTFFILQLFAMIACKVTAEKLRHRLTMPHTRRALSEFKKQSD